MQLRHLKARLDLYSICVVRSAPTATGAQAALGFHQAVAGHHGLQHADVSLNVDGLGAEQPVLLLLEAAYQRVRTSSMRLRLF